MQNRKLNRKVAVVTGASKGIGAGIAKQFAAEGAAIDPAEIALLHSSLPPGMRSSMQKDVAAGRLPELDAIAGPILHGATKNSLPVTTCRYLNDAIAQMICGSQGWP